MAKKRKGKSGYDKGLSTGIAVDFSQAISVLENLQKLSDERIARVIGKGFDRGMVGPIRTQREWFDYIHHKTGFTARAFKVKGTVVDKNIVRYDFGFDPKWTGTSTGPVALFFEYGTPRIRPEFVMYYSVKNNLPLLVDIVREEVEKAIEEASKIRSLDEWA